MIRIVFCTIGLLLASTTYAKLPQGFVYLSDVDPSIMQEMRYASHYNFLGRPLMGYKKPSCILTKQAAKGLKKAQRNLNAKGYSLKVYDCYRPKMAVNEMKVWSESVGCLQMKKAFFPREKKEELFKNGYIALYSGHSRGSTVDLTIVNLRQLAQDHYAPGKHLKPCHQDNRLKDNSIDMGTGFDCLDPKATVNSKEVTDTIHQNRLFLRDTMTRHGFKPYHKEWWHFTLKREPTRKYFNFPVE